jgi:NADPH2:quinone reductase
VPEPGPGEVLVEVHATAVNPLDVANVLGFLGTPLPMIPGVDFAGVVVSDGDHAGQLRRPPATWLSRKPECLTITEAGAIGRSYLAAWETVINAIELTPGETILITGGAGMVGHAARCSTAAPSPPRP